MRFSDNEAESDDESATSLDAVLDMPHTAPASTTSGDMMCDRHITPHTPPPPSGGSRMRKRSAPLMPVDANIALLDAGA
jgi:hypothetical protein